MYLRASKNELKQTLSFRCNFFEKGLKNIYRRHCKIVVINPDIKNT